MDGISLTINARDLQHLGGVFDAIVKRGQDTTPLMDDIASYGVASTKLRFRAGVGPDGKAWLPSARAKATGGQTLVDRGRLRSSISGFATANTAIWGSNLIYAPPHQLGATIKPKSSDRLVFFIPGVGFRSAEQVTIPARPFLGINSDDREEIEALVQDHYVGGIQ